MNAILGLQHRFDRRFYLGCGLIFLALMVWAFAKTYYLKILFGTPALTKLVHIHGIVMTGWIVLLVVQTSLIVAHRVRWHRRLGVFGGIWAFLVVILGSATTLHAAAREVQEHSPDAEFQVSVLGLELVQMMAFEYSGILVNILLLGRIRICGRRDRYDSLSAIAPGVRLGGLGALGANRIGHHGFHDPVVDQDWDVFGILSLTTL